MNDEKAPLNELLLELMQSFAGDLWEAQKKLTQRPTEYDKRNYVRAAFACIEGTIGLKKLVALQEHAAGRLTLSPQELSLARECSYVLGDDGQAQVRSRILPIASNALFALRLYAKAMQVPFEPDVESAGWRAFRQAIRIRDRITHPRSMADSRITDEELETVRQGLDWFQASSQIVALPETQPKKPIR